MIIVVAVLMSACVLVGLALHVVMHRRDEPVLGVYGMTALIAAGILSVVYGAMAAS